MAVRGGGPQGTSWKTSKPRPLLPGAGAPRRAPTQRARARGLLCSGATESRGSGVQNLEDSGAAAGSALRAGPSRQTAVREAGAVWHSRHFSTSIKPAHSRLRGRGKGARAVGSSPPAAAPPTPPHPPSPACGDPLGPAPSAGWRGDAALG